MLPPSSYGRRSLIRSDYRHNAAEPGTTTSHFQATRSFFKPLALVRYVRSLQCHSRRSQPRLPAR
jgi:hypothetical protein